VGERLDPRQWLGALVIVAATAVIAVRPRSGGERAPHTSYGSV
jgi:drug/metabolite transporter (DMT)-like permease